MLNELDGIFLGVLLLSGLLGLIRGLVRELIGLLIWGMALFIAWRFQGAFQPLLAPWVPPGPVRLAAAFSGLTLILVLLFSPFGAFLRARLVEKTGLGGTDHLFGGLFGAARGALILAMIAFLGALTPWSDAPWWRDSRLLPRFQVLSQEILDAVPPELVQRIRSA